MHANPRFTLAEILARHDWQNPACPHFQRIPAHPPFASWRDATAALADTASPSQQLLNGEWQFSYFGCPQAVPESWLEQDLPDANRLAVPPTGS